MTAKATSTMNLAQKILAITGKVGHQQKTGRNSVQGYGFIEQAAVVAAIRPLLEAYGVVILPAVSGRTIERFVNAKGNTSVHVNVTMKFTVMNADAEKDLWEFEWDAGEAIDTSDKATNKAVTAAHKSFLMKLFNISDKEDADIESPEVPQNRYINGREMTEIVNIGRVASGITDREELIKWITGVIGVAPNLLRSDELLDAMRAIKASDFMSQQSIEAER